MKPGSHDSSQNFQTVLQARFPRRTFLQYAAGAGTATLWGALPGCSSELQPHTHDTLSGAAPAWQFDTVPQGLDTRLTLPDGYDYQVLLRWGDPLFPDSAKFDPLQQTGEKQARQFGFNNDYVGFLPLPLGSDNSEHGLLTINHEHTKARLMHPGIRSEGQLDQEQTRVDIAAHGLSVIEVKKQQSGWQVVKGSDYTRRITPDTPMQLTGAAAGHPWLQTQHSEDGIATLGTYGNCAGGITPWGTILTAEENFDKYFSGDVDKLAQKDNFRRYGFSGEQEKNWSQYEERWDLNKHPGEAFHMGWIVEIDPYDPNSVPKKRTGLGRFKHEGANVTIAPDGRAVAYSGDDEKFEYVYRFVSRDTYKPGNDNASRAHNMQLLENGVLSVARFSENGTLSWLPLVHGKGPLTVKNGFNNQAEVLLNTRKAADLLGATPMDRPEDVDINPVSGKVYVMLTKNDSRQPDALNGPNPRAYNRGGQIIELLPPESSAQQRDHCADEFRWEVLLLAGKPEPHNAQNVTFYHPDTDENGWLACPDNCAFDTQGNIWVTTDGAEDFGVADGVWWVVAEGEKRGYAQRFMRAPVGAEVCGPCFTPDNRSFFCAIQHPGGDSNFDQPDTRWPDYAAELPPRPALIVVTQTR
ncbi:PhoX family protein [Planctobacterium marinum]|uniref:PhoX family protein n=1 Tax=Planctobacterium marinum TaxID=1631968 RepID=UPI001E5BBDB1|nr:PhoX family phosphatase [Planctobacterium marinum]MCC2606959.1 PhoX family phosphatase [Planctobacterium marinum]